MVTQYMLTTVDNPFSPFTEWDAWYAYDEQHGYHTTAYLARIVRTSNDLSQANQDTAIDNAIDEIVQMNVNGLYKKVAEPDHTTMQSSTS